MKLHVHTVRHRALDQIFTFLGRSLGTRLGKREREWEGLTCSNVAVSVFVIIEWVITGVRGVPR